jgi:hypothetical protein
VVPLVVVVVLVWEVEAGVVVVVVCMAFVLVVVVVVVEEEVVVVEVDEEWEAWVVLPSWVAVISPPLVVVVAAGADTDYNRTVAVVDTRIRSLDNRRVDTLVEEVAAA